MTSAAQIAPIRLLPARIIVLMLGACAALTHAVPAAAAGPIPLTIGRVSTTQACTTYRNFIAHNRSVAAQDAESAVAASETTVVSYLTRDCVDDFPAIRTTLTAALAASGKFAIGRGANLYTVTARLGLASVGAQSSEETAGFSRSSKTLKINMDVLVHDTAGRVVYGGTLSRALDFESSLQTAEGARQSSQSPESLYADLQESIARAAARLVAFHFEPLRVIGRDGRTVQLNYGASMLPIDTRLNVSNAQGSAQLRFLVISANDTSAIAELDGDGDVNLIAPGSIASVEEGDPRRFRRVDLP